MKAIFTYPPELNILNTLGIQRTVDEIYKPKSILQLTHDCPRLFHQHENFMIFSLGHNWGYGCNAPNQSGGVLIDLSLCQQIRNFDPEHGIITVEPGVSYGQLSKYLKDSGDQWLTPIHGGGPDCSVIGNALERGYGLTPYTDHFSAITCLKAILRNGKLYEGTLTKLGAPHLDRLFKHGIGPYYDGLFAQSGLGIVTEVTLRLAKKPEFTEMFYLRLLNSEDLEAAVTAIKKSKQDLGSILGGVNLMNQERVLSMLTEFPTAKIKSMEPLDNGELKRLQGQFQLAAWNIIGTFYGPEAVVAAAKKTLLKNFAAVKTKKTFINSKNIQIILKLKKVLEKVGLINLATSIEAAGLAFDVANGIPNNVALKLAYWKNLDRSLVLQENLNPSRDRCGIIWYAPLVEMKPAVVAKYVKFLNLATKAFGFNNLITLTTVDDLCFDSTVPILFDQSNELDKTRAHSFYNYLLDEGLKQGFFPYRLNIESQKKFDFQTDLFQLSLINKARYR